MAVKAWKLWTLNEIVQPAVRSYSEHSSKNDALKAACDELKKAHVKVELIEGPAGEKIDKDGIEQFCRSRQQP